MLLAWHWLCVENGKLKLRLFAQCCLAVQKRLPTRVFAVQLLVFHHHSSICATILASPFALQFFFFFRISFHPFHLNTFAHFHHLCCQHNFTDFSFQNAAPLWLRHSAIHFPSFCVFQCRHFASNSLILIISNGVLSVNLSTYRAAKWHEHVSNSFKQQQHRVFLAVCIYKLYIDHIFTYIRMYIYIHTFKLVASYIYFVAASWCCRLWAYITNASV